MRANIIRLLSRIITSPRTRSLRRFWHGLGRAFGADAVVHYFHEPTDPYSQLAAQLIDPLTRKYKVAVRSYLVSPPGPAAAPELEKLQELAKTDAAILAQAYGLKYPVLNATPKDARPGDNERAKLGHYLSGMFYFEGEWYWGVDRFHFLEERLHQAGLARSKGPLIPITPAKEVSFAGKEGSAKDATLDYFLSFRSPYTYLAVARVRKLAAHYGATLRLRFVLPMVMRGLPVPATKRFYILLDSKRESERLGIPFGTIVDPVGKPTERGLAVLHRAIALGLGPQFAESFLSGAFAEGIDAGSEQGLLKMAERAGLSAADVDAALKDEIWREVAETNRKELFSIGHWGVPTFRVNNNPAHWGQDRLWVIEQELQRV